MSWKSGVRLFVRIYGQIREHILETERVAVARKMIAEFRKQDCDISSYDCEEYPELKQLFND